MKKTEPCPGQLTLFEDAFAGTVPLTEPRPASPDATTTPSPSQELPMPRTATPPRRRASATALQAPRPVEAPPRAPRTAGATLDEVIPEYLTDLAATRSHHTLKSFELDLRLLRMKVGNRVIGTITTGDLKGFIAYVRDDSEKGRHNKDNSIRRKVASLKNFFGYLRDQGLLVASPADAVPYPNVQIALPEFLEEDEVRRLIEATSDNPFWRALLLLLLDTGLKRDEVLALRVVDVYLAPDPSREGYVVVRETDTAKRLRSRRVAVTERLYEALDAHYTSTARAGGESKVFDISVRGINFIIETCAERGGIERFIKREKEQRRLTPQVLRETFAVTQMRAFVAEERRRRLSGLSEEQMQLLTLKHDGDLLRLLGLKDDPDTAQKYRRISG